MWSWLTGPRKVENSDISERLRAVESEIETLRTEWTKERLANKRLQGYLMKTAAVDKQNLPLEDPVQQRPQRTENDLDYDEIASWPIRS